MWGSVALEFDLERSIGEIELRIALAVGAGETVALAGPSGAGKTTVLRLVAGLARPDRGRVVCGRDVWLDSARGLSLAPERRGCGYLFQEYALFPHLRAWENVAYGLGDVPRRERRGRAEALLARFGVRELADARPALLSGGERQRVALARALAPRPSVLLLDEPLSALDASTRAKASRELLSLLAAAEVPALLVTHDFEEASLLADRVAVLDRGRIVQAGPAAELAAAPRSAFVADFTGAAVLHGDAQPAASGLTVVALDGGGSVASTDVARGRVAASVFPWEIALEPALSERHGSAQNRLAAEVVSVTRIGNRVRVGLATPQPLAAEVTEAAVCDLALAPGQSVTATWKATATRLTPV
jgi:molybdate transport system ATP-binding protein